MAAADDGYVRFQRRHAGALLMGKALEIGLFGFDESVSMHIVQGPGDIIEYGVLTFCDVIARGAGTTVACGFGFEATGQRPPGIDRLEEGSSTRHSSTFSAWLRAVVERGAGVADRP